MSLKTLHKVTSQFKSTDRLPTLFLGHGSPMNAIEENEFVKGWREVGKQLVKPSAILCISAHWETKGTFVTAMETPKTIHDFYGFPKSLFEVQYPASGSPELAEETKRLVRTTQVELDHEWGLDHGSWSVVKHLYPKADIPVIQMSLDYSKPAHYHYELAQQLRGLRNKGVLIIGSGNMVHNLKVIDWRKPQEGFDWAITANEKLKNFILDGNHQSLIHYASIGSEMNLSIPTPEHYLPLLYVLALQEKDEQINLFNDKTIMGSISMTSLCVG